MEITAFDQEWNLFSKETMNLTLAGTQSSMNVSVLKVPEKSSKVTLFTVILTIIKGTLANPEFLVGAVLLTPAFLTAAPYMRMQNGRLFGKLVLRSLLRCSCNSGVLSV